MDKKIAVLAPGGIGSVLGGMMTRAGYDVVLIDQWPAHVDAMKAKGLRIAVEGRMDRKDSGSITKGAVVTPEAEFLVSVRAYHLYEVCTLYQQFDIVFLTCKSYDTRWMVQFIEPYLRPDGVLVSVQNSLNQEWIAPIIGHNRVISCVLNSGSWLMEPAYVWRWWMATPDYQSGVNPNVYSYTLGEPNGRITPRVEELAKIMSDSGKTRVSTNIQGVQWSKLVHNTMKSALRGLTGVKSRDLMDSPEYVKVAIRLGKEAMRVGVAAGYRMEPIFGLTTEDVLGSEEDVCFSILESSSSLAPGASNMVQQDLLRGRPTEIGGYLNGLVIRKGREFNVPTPMNEAVTEAFLRVERGELQQDMSNMDLLPLNLIEG